MPTKILITHYSLLITHHSSLFLGQVKALKLQRQQMILELVTESPIMTQEDLAVALRTRGVQATQATISRDIKGLQLVKTPVGGAFYRYTLPQGGPPDRPETTTVCVAFSGWLRQIQFQRESGCNPHYSGAAQGVASALDHSGWSEISAL